MLSAILAAEVALAAGCLDAPGGEMLMPIGSNPASLPPVWSDSSKPSEHECVDLIGAVDQQFRSVLQAIAIEVAGDVDTSQAFPCEKSSRVPQGLHPSDAPAGRQDSWLLRPGGGASGKQNCHRRKLDHDPSSRA
jgi:hypothetical protein